MSMHQKMRQQLNNQKGFTLIEIAIVLVIIGLLLGGVLKGQELINTARVRALNNSVDGITAAWFSFQDRYRAFPGDYSLADVNILAAADPGNGNGIVGNLAATDDPIERAQVWVHLSAAGYLSGSYDGDAANTAVGAEYTCPAGTCPDNGFGAGMTIFHGAEFPNVAVPTHELITGQGIPVEVIAELDRKIDDGLPNAGIMQTGAVATFPGCVVADGTAVTDNYALLAPVDNCAAVFRNF